MACGGCARRRLKQQAVSLEIAAQQEAEREAQRRAESLIASDAPVIVDDPSNPVVDPTPFVPDAVAPRRKRARAV